MFPSIWGFIFIVWYWVPSWHPIPNPDHNLFFYFQEAPHLKEVSQWIPHSKISCFSLLKNNFLNNSIYINKFDKLTYTKVHILNWSLPLRCLPIMPPRILPRLSKANLWKATVYIKVTPKYLWKATTIYIATKFEYYLLMWRDLSQDPHLWSLWPSLTALMCFLKLVNDFP